MPALNARRTTARREGLTDCGVRMLPATRNGRVVMFLLPRPVSSRTLFALGDTKAKEHKEAQELAQRCARFSSWQLRLQSRNVRHVRAASWAESSRTRPETALRATAATATAAAAAAAGR
eukprot:jgi/Tetstr1/434927/TSEL_023924.t1